MSSAASPSSSMTLPIYSKVGVVSRGGDEAADGDQRETDAAAAQGDDRDPGVDDQHGGQDLQVRSFKSWIPRLFFS